MPGVSALFTSRNPTRDAILRRMKRSPFGAMAGVCLAAGVMLSTGAAGPPTTTIRTVSTGADYVTGGDVLVEVIAATPPKVAANGRDVSAAFKATKQRNTYVGLVAGLADGKNILVSGDATLEVMNYPISGPVLSGPWQQPFICQTDTFKLPDGTTLGKPIDANCSANTVVQYVYKSTAGGPLKAMPKT